MSAPFEHLTMKSTTESLADGRAIIAVSPEMLYSLLTLNETGRTEWRTDDGTHVITRITDLPTDVRVLRFIIDDNGHAALMLASDSFPVPSEGEPSAKIDVEYRYERYPVDSLEPPGTQELVELVAEMRRLQRLYFKTRGQEGSRETLEQAKRYEREVDQAVHAILKPEQVDLGEPGSKQRSDLFDKSPDYE